MLSSGTEASVEAAIMAAERVATKIDFMLSRDEVLKARLDHQDYQQLGGANG